MVLSADCSADVPLVVKVVAASLGAADHLGQGEVLMAGRQGTVVRTRERATCWTAVLTRGAFLFCVVFFSTRAR